MKLSILILTFIISLPSFAFIYDGGGETGDFGTEACSMVVHELENNKLDVTVFGAGIMVQAIVDKTPTIEFSAETIELPSQKAHVMAIMSQENPIEPVTLQLTTSGEMVECNF